MTEFQPDDILQELDAQQWLKLCEMQAKIDHIQNLPSLDQSVLNDPKYHRTINLLSSGQESAHKWDASVLKTKEFAKAIGNLTPAQLRCGMWENVKHDDPDTLVVRHLRARNWDVDKALVMMLYSVRWRTENRVNDDIVKGGDLQFKVLAQSSSGAESKVAGEVMEQLRKGESFANGVDHTNRPLLFIRVSKHSARAQSWEGFERYTIYCYESARFLLRSPITTASVVFDLGGFSMSNMDWNAIKLITTGILDRYPEAMHHTYVYRAPWIVNGLWSVVKGWIHPGQIHKIKFVSDAAALSEFVDLKYVPKQMGGEAEWSEDYLEPVEGENDRTNDTETRDKIQQERDKLIEEYEAATRDWIELLVKPETGTAKAETGASANGEPVGDGPSAKMMSVEEAQNRRRALVTKLRSNYWQLDPYIRGRTWLDRMGMIPNPELASTEITATAA